MTIRVLLRQSVVYLPIVPGTSFTVEYVYPFIGNSLDFAVNLLFTMIILPLEAYLNQVWIIHILVLCLVPDQLLVYTGRRTLLSWLYCRYKPKYHISHRQCRNH